MSTPTTGHIEGRSGPHVNECPKRNLWDFGIGPEPYLSWNVEERGRTSTCLRTVVLTPRQRIQVNLSALPFLHDQDGFCHHHPQSKVVFTGRKSHSWTFLGTSRGESIRDGSPGSCPSVSRDTDGHCDQTVDLIIECHPN